MFQKYEVVLVQVRTVRGRTRSLGADKVSVGLFYGANFKWHIMPHMPLRTKRNAYFWDRHRARFPDKIKAQKHTNRFNPYP